MLAYLLVATKPNTEEKVFTKLQKSEKVKKVHILFGSWDIIAELEVADVNELNTFTLEKVRKIPDVTLTATMIVAK